MLVIVVVRIIILQAGLCDVTYNSGCSAEKIRCLLLSHTESQIVEGVNLSLQYMFGKCYSIYECTYRCTRHTMYVCVPMYVMYACTRYKAC